MLDFGCWSSEPRIHTKPLLPRISASPWALKDSRLIFLAMLPAPRAHSSEPAHQTVRSCVGIPPRPRAAPSARCSNFARAAREPAAKSLRRASRHAGSSTGRHWTPPTGSWGPAWTRRGKAEIRNQPNHRWTRMDTDEGRAEMPLLSMDLVAGPRQSAANLPHPRQQRSPEALLRLSDFYFLLSA
jgi:hypothetical protein